jgi:predicted NAD-dependent protein-ADP-ribosyltransferase YbiA (DUF1768 family)
METRVDPIVVRTYEGKGQADAAKKFAADAKVMGAQGYRVISQSWDEGKRGVVGAAMFGVFASKTGTLTVTYQLG